MKMSNDRRINLQEELNEILNWRRPPDRPSADERIVARITTWGQHIDKDFVLDIRVGDGLDHIEKWLPYEEYLRAYDELKLKSKN